MTSTLVNGVGALMNYVNSADNANVKTDESARDSFGKIMGKMSDDLNNAGAQTSSAGVTAGSMSVEVGAPKKDAAVSGKVTEKSSVKVNDKSSGNQSKDSVGESNGADAAAQDEVQKSGEQLVEEVAEEMDVTTEEVEEAMEVLGLTAVDLFQPENLKQLLLALSGSESQLSLVTDENLYMNLQNLFAAVDETLADLQQELGLSDEELAALLEQMSSEGNAADAVEAAGQEALEGLEGMKDYTVSIQKDGESVQVKVSVDDESGAKSVQEEVVSVPKAAADGAKTAERNFSEEGRSDGHAAGGNLLQTQTQAQPEISTAGNVPLSYQASQTEEIMDQIMEYMKINLKADVQEMELQLHPASLGTVNVQIAAKEGAITAQFTAQNEVVRAAIESQLIQLKEQFEEQGIKVDAVEVTVAGHEYGQQFDQENGAMRQDQKKAGKGARRLNLDELDEEGDLGELEESERISVEMMRANGSTVDYTA